MTHFFEDVEFEPLTTDESQQYLDDANRELRSSATTGPTDLAEMFNHGGSSEKWHIRVDLWGENDDVSKPPPFSTYLKSFVRTGSIERAAIRTATLGVYCRWTYYDTKTSMTYRTRAVKPPPIFGPRTYFKEIAIFWRASSPSQPDTAQQGGLIGTLP